MSEQTKVSIASDHAGFDLKDKIIKCLLDCGVDVIDRGPDKKDPVDYPDFASKVTNDILNEKAHKGVLVCGTGQGMYPYLSFSDDSKQHNGYYFNQHRRPRC